MSRVRFDLSPARSLRENMFFRMARYFGFDTATARQVLDDWNTVD